MKKIGNKNLAVLMSGLALGFSASTVNASLMTDFSGWTASYNYNNAVSVTISGTSLTFVSPPSPGGGVDGPIYSVIYSFYNSNADPVSINFNYLLGQFGNLAAPDFTYGFLNSHGIPTYLVDSNGNTLNYKFNSITGDNSGSVGLQIPVHDTMTIQFDGSGNQSEKPPASLILNMEVVPEPATWLAGFLLLGTVSLSAIRQKFVKHDSIS